MRKTDSEKKNKKHSFKMTYKITTTQYINRRSPLRRKRLITKRYESNDTRIRRIIRESEKYLRFDSKGKSRKREEVTKRQVLAYFLTEKYGFGYSEVGIIIGYDHSTVMHSRQLIIDLIKTDHSVKYMVGVLGRYLNSLPEINIC